MAMKRMIVTVEFVIEFEFEPEYPGETPEQAVSGKVDNYEELLGDEVVQLTVFEAREDPSTPEERAASLAEYEQGD